MRQNEIQSNQTSLAAPERFVAELSDACTYFEPDRPKSFGDRTEECVLSSMRSQWRATYMGSWQGKHSENKSRMTHNEIHFHQTTTLTPEQYVAGLTDFGPGRSKLFSNSADDYLYVHRRGRFDADVTEGSGGIWERLHYDWSDPNRVVLTTTDSNLWGGASGHTYTFTRNPNGTTDIDLAVVREGKNLKGRLLGFGVRTIGRRVLEKAFQNSVKAIEARNERPEIGIRVHPRVEKTA